MHYQKATSYTKLYTHAVKFNFNFLWQDSFSDTDNKFLFFIPILLQYCITVFLTKTTAKSRFCHPIKHFPLGKIIHWNEQSLVWNLPTTQLLHFPCFTTKKILWIIDCNILQSLIQGIFLIVKHGKFNSCVVGRFHTIGLFRHRP